MHGCDIVLCENHHIFLCSTPPCSGVQSLMWVATNWYLVLLFLAIITQYFPLWFNRSNGHGLLITLRITCLRGQLYCKRRKLEEEKRKLEMLVNVLKWVFTKLIKKPKNFNNNSQCSTVASSNVKTLLADIYITVHACSEQASLKKTASLRAISILGREREREKPK